MLKFFFIFIAEIVEDFSRMKVVFDKKIQKNYNYQRLHCPWLSKLKKPIGCLAFSLPSLWKLEKFFHEWELKTIKIKNYLIFRDFTVTTTPHFQVESRNFFSFRYFTKIKVAKMCISSKLKIVNPWRFIIKANIAWI